MKRENWRKDKTAFCYLALHSSSSFLSFRSKELRNNKQISRLQVWRVCCLSVSSLIFILDFPSSWRYCFLEYFILLLVLFSFSSWKRLCPFGSSIVSSFSLSQDSRCKQNLFSDSWFCLWLFSSSDLLFPVSALWERLTFESNCIFSIVRTLLILSSKVSFLSVSQSSSSSLQIIHHF